MAFDPYQWYNTISNYIKSVDPDLDTSIGTLIGDTTVLPASILYEKVRLLKEFFLKVSNLTGLSDLLKNDTDIQSLATAFDTTPLQIKLLIKKILADIAADYGLTRIPASPATGVVYFVLQPKTDYTGSYTIQQTDVIYSIFGLSYHPVTSYTFVINGLTPETSIESYYVPSLNGYAFPVKVQCSVLGPRGNIESGQIYSTTFAAPSHFLFVTNIDKLVGGRDEETDEELIERIRQKWSGSNYGTIGGYRSILAEKGITDFYIATIGSSGLVRSASPGAIDIYIRNYVGVEHTISNLLVSGAVYPYYSEYPIQTLKTSLQTTVNPPLHAIVATISPLEVVPSGLVCSAWLYKDPHSSYGGSTRAGDTIRFSMFDPSGSYHYRFNIRVLTNAYITDLQTLFQDPKYHVLGQDVLVREAVPVPIKIGIKINQVSGYDLQQLIDTAKSSILNYVNKLPLGSTLSQSDIINVLENIPGIKNVIVPFSTFNRMGLLDVVNEISCQPYNYLHIGSFDAPRMPVCLLYSGGTLTPGQTYYYRIIAINEDNAVTSTQEISITPTSNSRTAALFWLPCQSAMEYHIYRGTASQTYSGYWAIAAPSSIAWFIDSGASVPPNPPIMYELASLPNTAVPLLDVQIV